MTTIKQLAAKASKESTYDFVRRLSQDDLLALKTLYDNIDCYTVDDEADIRANYKDMDSGLLLRLADKLEGKGPYLNYGPVKTKQFDMALFYREEENRVSEGEKPGCGFAACAGGWAALDKHFQRRGLRVAKTNDFLNETVEYTDTATGEVYEGFDALEKLFKIPGDDVEGLFSPATFESRETPKIVARRIRKYVAEHTYK